LLIEVKNKALIPSINSDDLKEVLAKKQQQIDVKELLKSLHLTIEFENQLSKRFSQQSQKDDTHQPPFKFEKSISSVFEPYLGLYIEAEDGYVLTILTLHPSFFKYPNYRNITAHWPE
jgi:Vps53-like, N-terminal